MIPRPLKVPSWSSRRLPGCPSSRRSRGSAVLNGGAGERGCLTWRKSSYSNGTGGDCVEIAHGLNAALVRDSKARRGAFLVFSLGPWEAFIPMLKECRSG
ncbi:DUF397 domain-containing protein [Streptomyces sp. NPDC052077]|uniref:DUF397 domain-containing protein n=1 Tax=Streptomyces sp. NPDC052077 TaxID=3154757 RepID=UPI00344670DE